MAVLSKAQIDSLSNTERLALIDELWDSFEPPDKGISRDQTHNSKYLAALLEERLLDLQLHPEDEMTLAEARGRSLL